MSFDKNRHLSEDQLIAAVLDENDQPRRVREHLATCPTCSEEKARLQRDLLQMGRMAERYSPVSERTFAWDEAERPNDLYRIWQLHAAFGMLLATAMLLLIIWWPPSPGILPDRGAEPASVEMQESEKLMTEINQLTENALPAVYMEIIGEPESEVSYLDSDEAFIQFIVPPIDEDPLSGSDSETKGGWLC